MLKAFTLLLLLISLSICLYSQDSRGEILQALFGQNPRTKKDAEKPGHYEMVIQVEKTELNPGDSLEVTMHFTGYGEIGGSKLFFSTAKGIFSSDSSYVRHSLGLTVDSIAQWGHLKEAQKNPSYFAVTFRGMRNEKWKESTMYADIDSSQTDSYLLISELSFLYAPVYMHYVVKDNAEPGNYNLTFVYTYFNGQEWQGQNQIITFKVNNWFEHHVALTWILGFVVTVLGIIPVIFGIAKPIYEWVAHQIKKLLPRHP